MGFIFSKINNNIKITVEDQHDLILNLRDFISKVHGKDLVLDILFILKIYFIY